MFSFVKSTRGESLYQAYPNIQPPSMQGYQANNQYPNFPPKMNDGRAVLASWQPGAVVNESILKESGITSNWQYRKFLTENGDSIRQRNFEYSCNDVGYFIRNEDIGMEQPTGFGNPRVYTSMDEPIRHLGGQPSDLKQTYLSREQLEARRVIPTMTQDELIRKWGNVVEK